jgi:protein O-mannosyl-transferase
VVARSLSFARVAGRPSSVSVALTAAAIALAVYARALDAPFVFDDVTFADSAIVQVASLREAAGILSMEGVPRTLTMATFALNFLADGLDPRGYHLVNVALHVATALAVFVLMRSLLRRWLDPWWAARAAGIAWAGALLWLVHPIQTQPVVYTWQRATVLCACCYLWSLAAYVAGRSRQGWRRAACYAAAIGLGGLALLAKENAATLPAAVLLVEWFVFRPAPGWRSLAGAAAVVLAVAVISSDYLGPRFVEMTRRDYERRGFTPAERLLTESRVVVTYLGLLGWPHPSRLTVDYDVPLSRSALDPPSTVAALAAIGTLAAVAAYGLRARTLLSFAILWFLLHLAIESTIVPLDLAYEHRLYLPSVVPLVLAGGLVRRLLGETWTTAVAVTLVGVLLASWSIVRLELWRDPVRLWTDNARKAPNKARVHGNLAHACLEAGDVSCAERAFTRALEIDPRLDAAQNGLARILIDVRRDYAGAERELAAVLGRSPHYLPALVNRGVVQLRTGNVPAAAVLFEDAVRLEPNDRAALTNLATALIALRRLEPAASVVEHGLRVWPFHGRLHALESLVRVEQGDSRRARDSLRRALAVDPRDEVALMVQQRLDQRP